MPDHPLAEALAEATRAEPWLAARIAPGAGGESLAGLAADAGRLEDLAGRMAHTHGSDEVFVGATLLFERLAAIASMALAFPFYLRQRLPLAGPEALHVGFGADGEPDGITVTDAAFACPEGDPATGHADARVLPDAAALRALLRERLVTVVSPLVTALARPAKRGLRTQWRGAADMITIAAWCAGGAAGDEDGGIALAEALCEAGAPLVGQAGFRPFEHRGVVYRHRVRNTCCQRYRIPGKGYCFTCPLPKPAQRERRWHEHHEARGDPQ
ncbi:(2Fe-2S)-binding protein [Spiribacter halobius]|uniref:Ferric siderophore reductase C-terminal domain-containing protein n=1 Tax=Sediminicurvatus halobius TaxID=2182432 RepID=A0A2U2N1S7_9GAMM|nr:(2Fe-2S)-binding protein [Spiribacter halobius]PWG63136.1 hypothetical protein DEM34_09815 [Spiribacter halobius]UEX77586.1 (2Fe-2S)-binding protein [Spiribacter halobius]